MGKFGPVFEPNRDDGLRINVKQRALKEKQFCFLNCDFWLFAANNHLGAESGTC